MLASAVDKDEISSSLHDMKEIFQKSVFALAKELDIRLVDLSPPVECAAQGIKLLYLLSDTHWNSEGRQVAAAYVATILKNLIKGTRAKAGVDTVTKSNADAF